MPDQLLAAILCRVLVRRQRCLESVPFALWFDHKRWSTMARKQRLDVELVARGLAASRQQAQLLIRAGRVRHGDKVLDKPGTEVLPEAELLVQQLPRYVSRGGEKLVRALEAFPIAV